MAGSLNVVTIIGNLGADPEIRTLNSGSRVASFRLAASETWKDKSGQKQERTEWVPVVCFNEALIGVIEQYVEKGSKVFVQGKFSTRKWQDKDGNDRYSTEVVMQAFDSKLILLGGKGDRSGGGGSDGRYDSYDRGGSTGKQDARGNPREDFSADLDDEIPF